MVDPRKLIEELNAMLRKRDRNETDNSMPPASGSLFCALEKALLARGIEGVEMRAFQCILERDKAQVDPVDKAIGLPVASLFVDGSYYTRRGVMTEEQMREIALKDAQEIARKGMIRQRHIVLSGSRAADHFPEPPASMVAKIEALVDQMTLQQATPAAAPRANRRM